ncbi:MAG: hypothetical protein JSU92_10555 [Deltaproteobacteria bacterium]|nr:MAG: hypothetical protein JSU92_10555 [Deltaproteobacteria bacterium]
MRIFKFTVCITLIVFTLACSEDTIGRLRSKTTAIATVYCLPDPLDPGRVNVEPIVFFGAGNPSYLDDYQPISDATVVVTASGSSQSVRLLEDPAVPGTYGPDTYNDLALQPSDTYNFTITSEGIDYSLTISAPEAPTTLITSISSPTNTSLDISLEPDYPYQFVLVFDSEGNKTLDTRPETASELSRVILNKSVTSSIPVKNLPEEDMCRIVVLGGVEGFREDISPNLSILSIILAAGPVSKTLDIKNMLE